LLLTVSQRNWQGGALHMQAVYIYQTC